MATPGRSPQQISRDIRQVPIIVFGPPPLARAYNRVVDLGDATESLDRFVVNNSNLEFPPPHVQLIPSGTRKAPTSAELAINTAKDIQAIRKTWKSNETQKGPMKRGEQMGTYSHKQQEFLLVMKAYMLWEFVTRSAWPDDTNSQVTRAKEFATINTRIPGDEVVTESLSKAVSSCIV